MKNIFYPPPQQVKKSKIVTINNICSSNFPNFPLLIFCFFCPLPKINILNKISYLDRLA